MERFGRIDRIKIEGIQRLLYMELEDNWSLEFGRLQLIQEALHVHITFPQPLVILVVHDSSFMSLPWPMVKMDFNHFVKAALQRLIQIDGP